MTTTFGLGLLWPRNPIQQPLDITVRIARRRYMEREGCQPVAILLNPSHRPDLGLTGDATDESPTLLGLPVQFDTAVRPHHVFVLGPDPDDAGAKKIAPSATTTENATFVTPTGANQ